MLYVKYIANFLADHQVLFDFLLTEITWRNDMNSRKTTSYGKPYNYSGIEYVETEIPTFLSSLFPSIRKEIGFTPNNILINYYFEKSSKMGFHSDDISILEKNTGVIIISLGSKRIMSFKDKETKKETKIELEPGSLLYLENENQKRYLHAVLSAEDEFSERISITFRRII